MRETLERLRRKYQALNIATEGCYRVQVSVRAGTCSVAIDEVILDDSARSQLRERGASRMYLPILEHYHRAIKAIRNEVVKLQRLLVHIPPFYYLPTADVEAFNFAFAEVERCVEIAKTEAKQMYEQDLETYRAVIQRLLDERHINTTAYEALSCKTISIDEIDKLQVQLLDFTYCPSLKQLSQADAEWQRALADAEEEALRAEIARNAQELERKAQAYRQELLSQGLDIIRQQAQRLAKEVLAIMHDEASKPEKKQAAIRRRLMRLNRLLAFDPAHLEDFSTDDLDYTESRLVELIRVSNLADTLDEIPIQVQEPTHIPSIDLELVEL